MNYAVRVNECTMAHMASTRGALAGLLLVSCASSPSVKSPAPATNVAPLAVAGPRCKNGECTCRRVDDFQRPLEPAADEQPIAPGHKRFELRTGRGQDPITVTIDGVGRFEKSTTTVEPTCKYIDLTPGKHHIHVRATAADPDGGHVPALFVSEFGAPKQSWYRTFQFRCGGNEACSIGHMQEWTDEVQKVARGLHDACGSTRVEGVRWDALRSVGPKLAELDLDLTLVVYKFEPRFAHGTLECKGPSGAPAE